MKLDQQQLVELAEKVKLHLSERELIYFEEEMNQTFKLFKSLEKWDMHDDNKHDD